jgi:hypothetical protein
VNLVIAWAPESRRWSRHAAVVHAHSRASARSGLAPARPAQRGSGRVVALPGRLAVVSDRAVAGRNGHASQAVGSESPSVQD